MKIKTGVTLIWGGLGIVAAVAVPAWAASSSGNLIDLTVHVQQTMAGMGALPARTLEKKICMHPGDFDPQAFARAESQSDCKLQHYAQHGKVVTFDMACTGKQPVTSHGEFHLTGGANFTGTMHTAFSAAGHAITVDTAYTGKQVGTCTYQPPGQHG